MISFVGILSLPVLLVSILFIFFHAKFIRLYNTYCTCHYILQELMLHKFELLQFFSQDLSESQSEIFELSQSIVELEKLLCDFNFTDEDSAELAKITHEIDEAQGMYNQAKDELERFITRFPGKQLSTFLMSKSMK